MTECDRESSNKGLIRPLLLAASILLTLGGTAAAQGCADVIPGNWLPRRVTNPDPADRQAIMDLIHTYYWILDDKDVAGVDNGFPDLFTQELIYEGCRAGGHMQLVKFKGLAALISRTKDQFADLNNRGLRTRHFESNTLLQLTKNDFVQGKFTLLVTIQRSSSADVPELDYTASVKATFAKEDNVWKFATFTLITDTPEVEERAR
jgi:SnoaL-like domain